ncbi:uncharacterized protein EDB91DRAFT_1082370 [Suillus paluster]|uniref:uncharacterized protein n=1 Tax=Suillus paluster TaxID=48578 RepID=UPI001B87D11B|nr:uncharacterized protein EDB91DRAFT_1082370 [Suillus paluster]KAG1739425.1 hypothetical protein EDB91DRAFT_1082370 [Suillus paluster]
MAQAESLNPSGGSDDWPQCLPPSFSNYHDQSYTASSRADNQPLSSFYNYPLFANNNFITTSMQPAAEGRHPSITVRSGDGSPAPFSSHPSLFSNSFHLYDAHSGPSENINTPYIDSTASYDPSFASCFNNLDDHQPHDIMVCIDGMSTLPPGADDIPSLGEPVPFDEPFRLDEILRLRELEPLKPLLPVGEPSSLPTHLKSSRSRARPSKSSELQFHPYAGVSQSKLRCFAAITKDTPDTRAEPSQSTLQPIGPSVYDNDNETHQRIFKDVQETLIKDAVNITPFLSEWEKKQGIQQVLIDAASHYDPTLKSLFCTASAAVKCALQECSTGQEFKFGVTDFKPVYDSFSDYIDTQIVLYPELLARWKEYTLCVLATLRDISLLG